MENKNENIQIIDDGQAINEKQAEKITETIEKAINEKENIVEQSETVLKTLTQKQFEQHFFEIFDVVGDLWDMPEFKIQQDKPFEIAGAKVSAAKLYFMAEKYKILHFLIEPAGGWFGDMIAIACFAGAKANVVCKKYTGNPITGYLRKFLKKSGEQVKKNSLMSRIFGKGGENDGKESK